MIEIVKFSRAWAMPNKWTFRIAPIADLLARYIPNPNEWIDPFAGWTSPARHKNDINPDAPVEFHEDAEVFVKRFESVEGFLFDPPYSPRQISECYKSLGLKVGMKETQSAVLYQRVKDAVAPRIKVGGSAISFGWNTVGMGIKRGFEIKEILLVCHGGAHNDTIVTIEQKTENHQRDIFA